jgi:cyclopropane fatty-acyl-phospholipid synthase-like methyltransferase
MKKCLHDLLFKYFPGLWFVLKYRVENEYQSYVYCHNDLAAYGATLKKYRTMEKVFSALVRQRSFLEIGCDTGFFVLEAAMLGASKAVGVDRNARALARAEKTCVALGLKQVQFQEACIPDFNAKERFDVVIFMSAIHYMFSDKLGNSVLFETMDKLVEYLSGFVRQNIFIEFVSPTDEYALKLVAERFLKSGEYSERALLAALQKRYAAVFDLGETHYETRKLFLACKTDIPAVLLAAPRIVP